MEINKNIGLIECGESDQILQLNQFSKVNAYSLKKALVADRISAGFVQAQHPQVEIVHDKNAILHDKEIDLVLILGPGSKDLGTVGAALNAGKQVRIM